MHENTPSLKVFNAVIAPLLHLEGSHEENPDFTCWMKSSGSAYFNQVEEDASNHKYTSLKYST